MHQLQCMEDTTFLPETEFKTHLLILQKHRTITFQAACNHHYTLPLTSCSSLQFLSVPDSKDLTQGWTLLHLHETVTKDLIRNFRKEV